MYRTKTIVGAALVATITMFTTTVARAEGEDPAPTTTVVEQEEAPTTTMQIVVPVADPEPQAAEPEPAPATTTPTTEDTKPPVVEPDPNMEQMPVIVDDSATPATGSMVEVTAPPTTNVQQTHDQETVITGTQVAQATTGNNTAINDQDQPSGVAVGAGTSVSTGEADAIGSRDENTVTQTADVVLTGEAVANLLQIALILNIGAALANSGSNGVLSTPGGSSNPGAIGSGDATAIGNSIASYITQAANTTADNAVDDSASQLAISLFLGLAIANSGTNSVLGNGVAGSGGGIGTGDAMAIGNDSITDITQRAILLGADQATLNVLQRATVLNLGFALANSGLNDISGVAGSLLAASDEEDDLLAQQLFSMLLPALLQSYGYGAGSGTIQSGDAAAIGNQSDTQILQTAGAMATGDGIASILQDVLVANVGGAAANSGLNSLGSAKTLDPQTATAVVQMAAFLAQLLAMVHHSSSTATQLAAQTQSIQIPFGDLILTLDGQFGAMDTFLQQGEARANIRQISIIVSLGVAQANSGLNAVATMSDSRLLAAVNAVLPDVIGSGDADARNRTVVQICQRINSISVECLAPPVDEPETPVTPPTPTGDTPVTPPSDPGILPDTGEAPNTVIMLDPEPIPQGFRAPTAVPTSDSSTHGRQGLLAVSGSNVGNILWGASMLVLLGVLLACLGIRRRPVVGTHFRS